MDASALPAQSSGPRALAGPGDDALAVVLEEPGRLVLSRIPLTAPSDTDIVVDIHWTGISTGTERLLWSGRMPPFPGLGYPLVPGYESVGCVAWAGPASGHCVGDNVFVPGANCFGDVRGLFGGAASRLMVPGRRAHSVSEHLGRARRPAGAGGHGVARVVRAGRGACRTSSSVTACSGDCWRDLRRLRARPHRPSGRAIRSVPRVPTATKSSIRPATRVATTNPSTT